MQDGVNLESTLVLCNAALPVSFVAVHPAPVVTPAQYDNYLLPIASRRPLSYQVRMPPCVDGILDCILWIAGAVVAPDLRA